MKQFNFGYLTSDDKNKVMLYMISKEEINLKDINIAIDKLKYSNTMESQLLNMSNIFSTKLVEKFYKVLNKDVKYYF